MGGTSREGSIFVQHDLTYIANRSYPGGKAKPLKTAKKEKKELDEDEVAFREKQRDGTSHYQAILLAICVVLHYFFRCKSPERNGRKGKRQRTHERRTAGNQEVGQEISTASAGHA